MRLICHAWSPYIDCQPQLTVKLENLKLCFCLATAHRTWVIMSQLPIPPVQCSDVFLGALPPLMFKRRKEKNTWMAAAIWLVDRRWPARASRKQPRSCPWSCPPWAPCVMPKAELWDTWGGVAWYLEEKGGEKGWKMIVESGRSFCDVCWTLASCRRHQIFKLDCSELVGELRCVVHNYLNETKECATNLPIIILY